MIGRGDGYRPLCAQWVYTVEDMLTVGIEWIDWQPCDAQSVL